MVNVMTLSCKEAGQCHESNRLDVDHMNSCHSFVQALPGFFTYNEPDTKVTPDISIHGPDSRFGLLDSSPEAWKNLNARVKGMSSLTILLSQFALAVESQLLTNAHLTTILDGFADLQASAPPNVKYKVLYCGEWIKVH